MSLNRLNALIKKVETLNYELTSGIMIQNIVFENEAYIIDMNAEDQLFEQGINNLGVDIMDYAPYVPYTIDVKKARGQPYDRVTLRDEGFFYESFFIEADNEKFEIKAADMKTEELIRKYGRQILGLTDQNLQSLIESYIIPDMRERIKQILS